MSEKATCESAPGLDALIFLEKRTLRKSLTIMIVVISKPVLNPHAKQDTVDCTGPYRTVL